MNKLTKIAIAISLFTSLTVKAEELAEQAAPELSVEAINHLESIPGYQAAEESLDAEAAASEEAILDEAVSSEEAEVELPQ